MRRKRSLDVFGRPPLICVKFPNDLEGVGYIRDRGVRLRDKGTLWNTLDQPLHNIEGGVQQTGLVRDSHVPRADDDVEEEEAAVVGHSNL